MRNIVEGVILIAYNYLVMIVCVKHILAIMLHGFLEALLLIRLTQLT